MWVERIGLEHHGKATLRRGIFGDILAVDEDLAARGNATRRSGKATRMLI